jgi:hypothetical protein
VEGADVVNPFNRLFKREESLKVKVARLQAAKDSLDQRLAVPRIDPQTAESERTSKRRASTLLRDWLADHDGPS